jgi:GNAT superfamily N-acetyltransferase
VPGALCGPAPVSLVLIRQAESRDVASVTAIVRAAYEFYVPRIGREPAPMTADYAALVDASEVWVGVVDERIVGVLVIRTEGDSLQLDNVAVEPSSKGHGYGRALIGFAEEHARQLALRAVTLYTNEAMSENLHLYPRLGYVETDRRVEDGYRRVFFRKSLDSDDFER